MVADVMASFHALIAGMALGMLFAFSLSPPPVKLWHRWLASIALGCLVALGFGIAIARAQMPDYCSAPVAAKDDPATALDWRLRCTIQKLEAERVQQADRATQDEVEIARLAALLRSVQAGEPQKPALPTVIKGRK